MKRREIYLLAFFYTMFSLFLPDLIPGRLSEQADEAGCALVDYARATTFPEHFSRIQDPELRKQELIDLLLPLVLKANEDILSQRHELQRIQKAPGPMVPGDHRFIEEIAAAYHVDKGSHRVMLEELLVRVDVLPSSLVLAQAAIESGWGTSRFAREGNNVFGLRGPGGAGMTPSERSPACGFSLSTFEDLQGCINYYMWNINTRTEYERLRKLRTQKRIHYDPFLLAQGLDTYSESGSLYVHRVVSMIRENNLDAYDSYRLRPVKDQRTARVPVKIIRPGGIS